LQKIRFLALQLVISAAFVAQPLLFDWKFELIKGELDWILNVWLCG
jgi:hypothetical protein